VDENFFIAAGLAKGDYIWLFSDDDAIEKDTVKVVLQNIADKNKYDLIVLNAKLKSKDLKEELKRNYLGVEKDEIICSKNTLLKRFGIKLGFISSIIAQRYIFEQSNIVDYKRFIEYGFSFLFVILSSIKNKPKIKIIASRLVLIRQANALYLTERWYKIFAVGSSLVLDELRKYEYTEHSIKKAKYIVLKDYVVCDLSYRKRLGASLRGVPSVLIKWYSAFLFFWIVCLPVLYMPKQIVQLLRAIYLKFLQKK